MEGFKRRKDMFPLYIHMLYNIVERICIKNVCTVYYTLFYIILS